MNLFQALWTKAGKEFSNEDGGQQQSDGGGEDATVRTARAISQQIFDHKLTEAQTKWAGPAVHYGFGALVGAAYGILAETVPTLTAGYGTAYGSAVWLAADEIGVPAFGLSQPPSETPVTSHLQALASHLVYGVTTDLTRRALLLKTDK
jgi:putative membrane protein